MIEASKVIYRFKGERLYVHGTDIFNSIIQHFDEERISKISLSIHAFIFNHNCKILVADSLEDLLSEGEAKVRCNLVSGRNSKYIAIREEAQKYSEAPIRIEYDEGSVISKCKLHQNEIVIHKKSPYTFIETVVAMNKYLLKNLFPDKSIKWVFTKIDLIPYCNSTNHIKIKFVRNLNFKLTKSEIYFRQDNIGSIYFSAAEK